MERTKSQFARLLQLDRLIRGGKHPNCLTFGADWEVAQKTVQRDIDYLRDQLGAPIEYDRQRKGFFYTDPGWFLPSLTMSEGELYDLLVAGRALEQYGGTPVAAKLKAIFRKVAALLPDKIRVKPELVFARFTFTAPPARPISEGVWVCLVRGLLAQRLVRIRYRAFGQSAAVDRVVAPYHVANLQGEWYAFGPGADGGVVKQYAMARIARADLTSHHFEMDPGFDPDRLLADTFGRFTGEGGASHAVRLLFDKEVASWVLEREWHSRQKIKTRRNGDVELSFRIAGLFEVFRWVLAWGRHAKVLEPAELRKMVWEEVRAMGKRGGGAEADGATQPSPA